MRKSSGRPFFEQPTPPKCMWPRCPHQTMISKEASICLPHAIIISDQLALKDRKPTRAEIAAREQMMRELESIRRWEEEEQTQRFNAGRPMDQRMVSQPASRVYYVLVGEHIKIGYTQNISVRLTSYPPNSELLGVELGDKDVERQRHDQFHAYLAYGREWFADCQEIRDHIATLPRITDRTKKMRRGPANQVPTIKPRYWR